MPWDRTVQLLETERDDGTKTGERERRNDGDGQISHVNNKTVQTACGPSAVRRPPTGLARRRAYGVHGRVRLRGAGRETKKKTFSKPFPFGTRRRRTRLPPPSSHRRRETLTLLNFPYGNPNKTPVPPPTPLPDRSPVEGIAGGNGYIGSDEESAPRRKHVVVVDVDATCATRSTDANHIPRRL